MLNGSARDDSRLGDHRSASFAKLLASSSSNARAFSRQGRQCLESVCQAMKRQKGEETSWALLPTELRWVVASFLFFQDMAPMPCVCSAWKAPIDCSAFPLHYNTVVPGRQLHQIVKTDTVRELVVGVSTGQLLRDAPREFVGDRFVTQLAAFGRVRRLVLRKNAVPPMFEAGWLEHVELLLEHWQFLGLGKKLASATALRTLILKEVPLRQLYDIVEIVQDIRERAVSCSIHVRQDAHEYSFQSVQRAATLLEKLMDFCTLHVAVDETHAEAFAKLDLHGMDVSDLEFNSREPKRWLVKCSQWEQLRRLALDFPRYDPELNGQDRASMGQWKGLEVLALAGCNCFDYFSHVFFAASLRALTLSDEYDTKNTALLSCGTLRSLDLINFHRPVTVHARLETVSITFTQRRVYPPSSWGPIALPDSTPACRILVDAMEFASLASFTHANKLRSLDILGFLPMEAANQAKHAFNFPPRTRVNASFLSTLSRVAIVPTNTVVPTTVVPTNVSVLEQHVLLSDPYAAFVADRFRVHQLGLSEFLAPVYTRHLATGSLRR